MTAEDVKRNLAALPFVTRLKTPADRCDGIKWGTVAVRDIYSIKGAPARGIQERSRCKRKGWFRFRATKQTRAHERIATSGTYCTDHLLQQLEYPAEERRTRKYFDKHGWWGHPGIWHEPKEAR